VEISGHLEFPHKSSVDIILAKEGKPAFPSAVLLAENSPSIPHVKDQQEIL
jgi:hypothetical protein